MEFNQLIVYWNNRCRYTGEAFDADNLRKIRFGVNIEHSYNATVPTFENGYVKFIFLFTL